MLYKQIYYVSLMVYATINKFTSGAIYYARTTNVGGCSSAGIDDHCVFLCDEQDWKSDFNCGNAGICDIKCEKKQCLMGATITASNSLELRVFARSQNDEKCYKKAKFRLPNSGSAYFSATDNSKNPYQEMIVNAGSHTKDILIDCAGGDKNDECKLITVNAQTADFLYINIEDGVFKGKDIDDRISIYCPQNAIAGPYGASCYIDANNQATLSNIAIHTLYGMPHDVLIAADNANNWWDVVLTCSGIDNTLEISTANIVNKATNDCWNTRAPTRSTRVPSAAPTIPTPSPTRSTNDPTSNPTKKPTPVPTDIPTSAPTTGPTNAPTLMPSDAPTSNPVPHPTTATSPPIESPTHSPTHAPTLPPTFLPTGDPTPLPTAEPSQTTYTPTTATPSITPTSAPTSFPTWATSMPSVAPTFVTRTTNTEEMVASEKYNPFFVRLFEGLNSVVGVVFLCVAVILVGGGLCALILWWRSYDKPKNKKGMTQVIAMEGRTKSSTVVNVESGLVESNAHDEHQYIQKETIDWDADCVNVAESNDTDDGIIKGVNQITKGYPLPRLDYDDLDESGDETDDTANDIANGIIMDSHDHGQFLTKGGPNGEMQMELEM
eukprot:89067_1